MLTLAAIYGEASLRGMWLWVCAHWERLAQALDLWEHRKPPSYGMLWNLLAKLDAEELAEAMCGEGAAEVGISVDGKVLRGSKRAAAPTLQVITAAGHRYREVLGQRVVEEQDLIAAAVELLHKLPLAGKLVSLDAQVMQRAVVKTIVEKGGPTLGSSKAIMGRSRRLCTLG